MVLTIVYFMKVNILMDKNVEKEKNIIKMVHYFMKVIILMVKKKDTEKSIMMMEHSSKGNIWKIKNMMELDMI